MSGDGVDGGDNSGGPPPEVPPEIGGGNQTTSAEYPSIPENTAREAAYQPADAPKVGAAWVSETPEAGARQDNRSYAIDEPLLQKARDACQRAQDEANDFSPVDESGQPIKTASYVTDSTTIRQRTNEALEISDHGVSYWMRVEQLEGSNLVYDSAAFFTYWEGTNELGSTMSGFNEQPGYLQGTERALELVRGDERMVTPDHRRFDFPNHPLDPPGQKGWIAASHAETQGMALFPPNDQTKGTPDTMIYGVSRPQCIDCRAFAQTLAMHQEGTIIVAGPDATRIFYRDGTVGVLMRGEDTIRLYNAQSAWETWKQILYAPPGAPSTSPGRSAAWANPAVYERTRP
jgi:hypothetical protein